MSVIDETRIQGPVEKSATEVPQVERATPASETMNRAAVAPIARETADDRLLNRVSALRDRTQNLDNDVRALHDGVRAHELDERTTAVGMRNPRDLLRELSHRYGLSWTAIARLAGVSPTAVRKWRRGENITAENRRSIARAVTFMEMLSENANPIDDMGSWLEMPLSDAATLTPIDLYVAGQLTELLDHVAGRLSSHAMLDQFDQDWRERYSRDTRFEVVDAGDGNLSIRERSS